METWPADLSQVTQEIVAQANLATTLPRVRTLDIKQFDNLTAELSKGRSLLFQDIFRVLDDTNITEALNACRQKFGHTAFSNANLSLRFNLLFHEFRATNDFSRMRASELKSWRNNLQSAVENLGGGLTSFDRLPDIWEADLDHSPDKTPPPPLIPFWERSQQTDSLVYSWTTRSKTKHILQFFPVVPPRADAAYLCSTELQVGLVKDWLKEHQTNIEDYITWLKKSDPRQGVRTWEAEEEQSAERPIRQAISWQISSSLFWQEGDTREYANFGKPSDQHPINYLSPRAAKFVAEALGFRLPIQAEWQAAYDAEVPHEGNLRDVCWEKQKEYISSLHTGFTLAPLIPWPDKQAFFPATVKVPQNAAASWRTGLNDGFLWFAKVDEAVYQKKSAKFIHLVGNVAEYLYDSVGTGTFYVAGGSALSAPELELGRPYPITSKSGLGFSDVGLRLALTAPMSPVDRFRLLVAKQRYKSDR